MHISNATTCSLHTASSGVSSLYRKSRGKVTFRLCSVTSLHASMEFTESSHCTPLLLSGIESILLEPDSNLNKTCMTQNLIRRLYFILCILHAHCTATACPSHSRRLLRAPLPPQGFMPRYQFGEKGASQARAVFACAEGGSSSYARAVIYTKKQLSRPRKKGGWSLYQCSLPRTVEFSFCSLGKADPRTSDNCAV